MHPHQQRVVDEKSDLDEKVVALTKFIGGNPLFGKLDDGEQRRLVDQLAAMTQYAFILGERIANF